jgi:hypothetical protein
MSDMEVLQRWNTVMEELESRTVIRSTNGDPVGGYAERLVARHLPATRPDGADRGIDLVTPEGRTIQVKGRRDPAMRPASHFDFTHFEERRFEEFVGGVFTHDFSIRAAWQIPWETLEKLGKPSGRKYRVRFRAIEAALVDGDRTIRTLVLGQKDLAEHR